MKIANNMNQVKITGEWDGEKIWREKTTGETLAEELEKNQKEKLKNSKKI